MSAGSLNESGDGPFWWERLSQSLNYDFCPKANRWVYWMKNPIWGLFLATGVSAVCGFFVSPQCYLITVALSAVCALGTFWPWVSLRGIQCSISFDRPRVREHDVAGVILKVTNRCPWPVWGLTIHRGFASDPDASTAAGTALAYVPGWSTTEYLWEFRPTSRGVYPKELPRVETSFPFGLFRSEQPVESCGALIVWPKTVSLDRLPDSEDMRLSEDRFSDRRAGDYGDMLGTRPFRDGDSLRRVHWVQTARQRTLVVSERQAPATTAVRVIVDTHLRHVPDRESFEARETMIRVAASICESLSRQHAFVECILGSTRVACGSSSTAQRVFMDELAKMEFSTCDLPGTPRCTPKVRSCEMLEIVITTSDASSWASSQRRRVIFVSPDHEQRTASLCPWLIVPGDSNWSQRFPRLWRNACHAA